MQILGLIHLGSAVQQSIHSDDITCYIGIPIDSRINTTSFMRKQAPFNIQILASHSQMNSYKVKQRPVAQSILSVLQ